LTFFFSVTPGTKRFFRSSSFFFGIASVGRPKSHFPPVFGTKNLFPGCDVRLPCPHEISETFFFFFFPGSAFLSPSPLKWAPPWPPTFFSLFRFAYDFLLFPISPGGLSRNLKTLGFVPLQENPPCQVCCFPYPLPPPPCLGSFCPFFFPFRHQGPDSLTRVCWLFPDCRSVPSLCAMSFPCVPFTPVPHFPPLPFFSWPAACLFLEFSCKSTRYLSRSLCSL